MPISRANSGALARVQAKLLALPEAVLAPIQQEVQRAGQDTFFKMVQRAPKATGELINDIKLEFSNNGLTATISVKRVAKRGRPYNIAWFLEWAKNDRKKRRFMMSAWNQNRKALGKNVGKRVRDAIGMVARRS